MALLQKAYLGATPLFRNVDWFEDGSPQIITSSATTTVTADNTAHVKGPWAQLIASTGANTSFVVVRAIAVATTGANTATLLDIATGASGSETAIVSNIAIGGAAAAASVAGIVFGFPFKIASGTRISARIQSVVTGGKTASIAVTVIDAGDYATAPTSVDVIGGDTATSQAISFSGSSGTWVQAAASTSRAYRAVATVLSLHNSDSANINAGLYEIGVGASGSEVAFGGTRFYFDTSERSALIEPYTYLFGRNIPAGSRLAVKHPISANPDRYGFNLIGIP